MDDTPNGPADDLAPGPGPGPDRGLPALLAAFGFTAGLLACFVADLIAQLYAQPVRVNFAYVEEEHLSVALMVPISTIIAVAVIALAGALAGWLIGRAATRRGWGLTRRRLPR